VQKIDPGVRAIGTPATKGSTGRGTFGSAHAFPIRERCLLGSSTRQKVAPSDPDSREPVPPPLGGTLSGTRAPSSDPTRRKRFPSPDPSGRSGPERNVATSLGPVNAMRVVGLQGDPNDVAGSGARVHEQERVTNDVAVCDARLGDVVEASPSRHDQRVSAPRPTSTNEIRTRDACRRAALGCRA
jgi:hypothetical protein